MHDLYLLFQILDCLLMFLNSLLVHLDLCGICLDDLVFLLLNIRVLLCWLDLENRWSLFFFLVRKRSVIHFRDFDVRLVPVLFKLDTLALMKRGRILPIFNGLLRNMERLLSNKASSECNVSFHWRGLISWFFW